ncbi:MAG: thiamine pyrophosphate-dependent dehydrogenase E1 component subunit alpha, partial [Bacteroidetes bacterium]
MIDQLDNGQVVLEKPTFSSQEILNDYRIACESRQVSLMGRKEVFMGKAKFGIFGDGKEVAQLAMAKAFRKGDFRSGYYRDQTFMFAIGEVSLEQYFAQLYAHADVDHEPATGGRCMNAHFGTRFLDKDGLWKSQTDTYNTSSDVSSTGTQMPRLVGLAYASKLYRNNPELKKFSQFSINGNEIAFGTIGNAATSEGMFYEAINAAGVLQIPMVASVWDDHYGISVPQEFHTTKLSISEALAGFQRDHRNGLEIFTVKGWDYEALCQTYQKASELCRTEHIPVLIHVLELTQPQGHSTSGSHERYKSKERIDWELEHDCNLKMRNWILAQGFATEDELEKIEETAKDVANKAKNRAWSAYQKGIIADQQEVLQILNELVVKNPANKALANICEEVSKNSNTERLETIKSVKKALRVLRFENSANKVLLKNWLKRILDEAERRYSSHLYSESAESGLNFETIAPTYDENSPQVDGRQILQACFDEALAK